jgi:hypothetical protein
MNDLYAKALRGKGSAVDSVDVDEFVGMEAEKGRWSRIEERNV